LDDSMEESQTENKLAEFMRLNTIIKEVLLVRDGVQKIRTI